MMKNVFSKLFILTFAFFALLSCSDSDETVSYNPDDLIGTWNLSSFNYEGDVKAVTNGVSVTIATFSGRGKNIDATSTFSKDPNKVISQGSYDQEITATAEGQTESETYEIRNFTDESEWDLTNDLLIIKSGQMVSVDLPDGVDLINVDESDAKIIELTATSLKLRKEYAQEHTQEGVTTKFVFNLAMDYTR